MSAPLKNKLFMDPVHGYIEVPSDLCSDFIDTPIFQRLRSIEQTNMRVLFPGAHHDRFAHSIGVYYLAKQAYLHLIFNTKIDYDKKILKEMETTFIIACLMHDCGHAPYSHTFEEYFESNVPNKPISNLDEEIYKIITDNRFQKDFKYVHPEQHEKMSVIVLLSCFKGQLKKHKVDSNLAARMITRCTFRGNKSQREKLANCLIEILNSDSIDVDKLDYILRDSWASGITGYSVDVNRLLYAITICKLKGGECHIGFKKQALSVIQMVIDARNFIYKWIFGHHKVILNDFLLRKAFEKIANRISCGNPELFYQKYFSLNVFKKVEKLQDDTVVFLPSDSDIVYLLKKYHKEIPYAGDYLFRRHKYALWKNYEEYDREFDKISDGNRETIMVEAESKLFCDIKNKFSSNIVVENDIIVSPVKPKLKTIERNSLFINIKEEILTYDDFAFPKQQQTINPSFFYVYVPYKLEKYGKKIIKILRGYA